MGTKTYTVGELVLVQLEGRPPQYGVIASLTDDPTYPALVQAEDGPRVVTGDELRQVHIVGGESDV